MRTSTDVLIKALYILARDIDSVDGVPNAALAEAASRLEEQQRHINNLCTAGDVMYDLLNPPSPSMRTVECDNALQGWDDAKIRL